MADIVEADNSAASKMDSIESNSSLMPMSSDPESQFAHGSSHLIPQNSNSSRDTAADKLDRFREMRDEEQNREFRKVTKAGFRVCLAGALIFVLSQVIGDFDWIPLKALGLLGISGGIVLLSTCPTERVNLNSLFASWIKLRTTIGFSLFGLSAASCANLTDVGFALPMIAGLFLAIGPRCLTDEVPLTTRITAWVALDLLAMALEDIIARLFVFHLIAYDIKLMLVRVGVFAAAIAVICINHCWKRHRVPPTTLMHDSLYIYMAGYAIDTLVRYALTAFLIQDKRPPELFSGFCSGLASSLAVIVAMIMGRRRLYRVVARRLDSSAAHNQRAGIFIANLLEAEIVDVGDVWYVLRPQPDLSFPEKDVRRLWRQGEVLDIDEEALYVRFEGEQTTTEMPLPVLSDLASIDRSKVRCVDFSRLTLEIFETGQNESGYSVSRNIVKGEQIDFFISHSWYDCPKAKYLAIEKVGRTFQKRYGREATAWLDKCCIDQDNISDGLRTLPVVVMTCTHMLLLLGPSYPKRLWCIWELFTLLAVHSIEAVQERIVIEDIGSREEGASTAGGLLHFDIDGATCFDPNEERRLRSVIAGLGEDYFCMSVQTIAAGMLQPAAKRPGVSCLRQSPVDAVQIPVSTVSDSDGTESVVL